jgi:hypothetical protein
MVYSDIPLARMILPYDIHVYIFGLRVTKHCCTSEGLETNINC